MKKLSKEPEPVLKEVSNIITWKKVGGGSLRLKIEGKRRIIKSGQIFRATAEEISEGFRDVVIPQEKIPTPKIEGVIPIEYSIEPRSKGYWDIIDSFGKVLNEKALRRKEADELLTSLLA